MTKTYRNIYHIIISKILSYVMTFMYENTLKPFLSWNGEGDIQIVSGTSFDLKIISKWIQLKSYITSCVAY